MSVTGSQHNHRGEKDDYMSLLNFKNSANVTHLKLNSTGKEPAKYGKMKGSYVKQFETKLERMGRESSKPSSVKPLSAYRGGEEEIFKENHQEFKKINGYVNGYLNRKSSNYTQRPRSSAKKNSFIGSGRIRPQSASNNHQK